MICRCRFLRPVGTHPCRFLTGVTLTVVVLFGMTAVSGRSDGPLAAVAAVAAEENHVGPSLPWFRIRAIDEETGRGVPMVRFTASALSLDHYTDNIGVIAFFEPGLMGQDVYFEVEGHGYEVLLNDVGERAVVLRVDSGGETTVRLRRRWPAQRLYRVTGLAPYRDSRLLGDPIPKIRPPLKQQVIGQDSVYVEPYRGRLFWLWGDTFTRLSPKFDAHYEVTAATTPLPGPDTFNPAIGIPLEYCSNADGSLRKMVAPEDGGTLTWFDGLINLTDDQGNEHLFSHYFQIRRLPVRGSVPEGQIDNPHGFWWQNDILADRVAMARMREAGKKAIEQYRRETVPAESRYTHVSRGLMKLDNDARYFRKVAEFPLREADELHIGAQALRASENGTDYVLFPSRRVRADVNAIRDILEYESFTCLKPGKRFHNEPDQLDRKADGILNWAWKRDTSAIGPEQQTLLLEAGHIRPDERWIVFRNVLDEREIAMQHNTIRWNPHRRRYVGLFSEQTPKLSQTWYAESDSPTGPWTYMRKVVSHNGITFYNPCHHFDQYGGRVILFEGTVTLWKGFGETTQPSLQHYDYNQMMYSLDLDDSRLYLPVSVYSVGMPARFATKTTLASDHSSLPAPVFFAPDRPRAGTVAVYQSAVDGTLGVQSPQLGAFRVLREIHHC